MHNYTEILFGVKILSKYKDCANDKKKSNILLESHFAPFSSRRAQTDKKSQPYHSITNALR